MMKEEFERLAKIEVSQETYSKVIEPMYLATDLSMQEFVKLLNVKAFAIPKSEPKNIKKMLIRDNSGYTKTLNGCWYHIKYVELVDIDIKTGKYIVKSLEEKDLQKLADEGRDLHFASDYDFDYVQCVDTKKKAITLM